MHNISLSFITLAVFFLSVTGGGTLQAATIKIDKITIAVDSMEQMAEFYSAVFDVEFSSVDIGRGLQLRSGKIGDMELLLCPKQLAGIDAKQNTIQLRFVIADIKKAHAACLANGGKVIGEPQETEGKTLSAIRDPDGNSIELAQE